MAAAISSARQGVNTRLLEEGPWLGGMLTAAGVSGEMVIPNYPRYLG